MNPFETHRQTRPKRQLMPRIIDSPCNTGNESSGPRLRAEHATATHTGQRDARDYTERFDEVGPSRLRELLELTRGCWEHGDGLRYQNAMRDGWTRR